MKSGWSQLSFLCSNEANIVRTCGTVIAGVDFFSAPRFMREKPGTDQRKRLMMMPTTPGADFIIGQTGFALGTLQAFLDAMLRFAHPSKLSQRRVVWRIGQIVIMLHRAIRLTLANHHQRFVKTLPRRALGADTNFHGFDH